MRDGADFAGPGRHQRFCRLERGPRGAASAFLCRAGMRVIHVSATLLRGPSSPASRRPPRTSVIVIVFVFVIVPRVAVPLVVVILLAR